MLVAVPAISGVIESSRKSSFASSASMIVNEIKSRVAISDISGGIYSTGGFCKDNSSGTIDSTLTNPTACTNAGGKTWTDYVSNQCYVDMAGVDLDRGKFEGNGYVLVSGADTKTYTVYAKSSRGYLINGFVATTETITATDFDTNNTNYAARDAKVPVCKFI